MCAACSHTPHADCIFTRKRCLCDSSFVAFSFVFSFSLAGRIFTENWTGLNRKWNMPQTVPWRIWRVSKRNKWCPIGVGHGVDAGESVPGNALFLSKGLCISIFLFFEQIIGQVWNCKHQFPTSVGPLYSLLFSFILFYSSLYCKPNNSIVNYKMEIARCYDFC